MELATMIKGMAMNVNSLFREITWDNCDCQSYEQSAALAMMQNLRLVLATTGPDLSLLNG